ncbi:MAG TPA: FAD-dependent oxidoreductase [Trueperaceae bacterium]|nr:FAD-dependent oxidoreductase [Trueperaceae bacterium]
MSAPQPSPLRVAVIGAGPSGFYATDALLKQREDVSIDLFDRLPTPYGLVRYGVAPDHQKLKSVTRLYERTCGDPRVRFLGNVAFGSDLTHEDVRRHYHAVIYAVGAPSDRQLGIPGEEKTGCLSATEFVAWYNGHPDYVSLEVPLDAESVAVVGVGNVAVDVARVLSKSVDELADTDMADYAIEHLRGSRVTDVYMLGRRGPAEAKFTTKELRELGELANADIVVLPEELEVSEDSLKAIEGDATRLKNLEVLREMAEKPLQGKPRRLHIRFCVSPVEVLGDGRIEAVRLERNRLEADAGGYMRSLGTGRFETLPAQLLLRSVGYRGTALPGVPFDARKNVIPNDRGRVLEAAGGAPVAGEYVAGWIKRGPTGVIGTNKADAMETVEQLLADDLPEVSAADASPAAVDQLLHRRGVRPFGFEHWLALDKYEQDAGKTSGRPRVKVTAVEDMLRFARAAADTEA